ncbi:MAG: PAS domain-containing protein, partial [Acidobacteria bacterium]
MARDEIDRNILESMSDGVMTIGTDGRILTFNRAAEQILALGRGDAVGRSLGEVFFEREGNDEFTQTILNAVYERGRVHDATVPYHDGTHARTLSVRTSFLQSESGDPATGAAVVVVFSDVTEVERLREAERQLTGELQAKHKELQGSYV